MTFRHRGSPVWVLGLALAACLLAPPGRAQLDADAVATLMPGCRLVITSATATTPTEAGQAGRCMGIVRTLISLSDVLMPQARFCPPAALSVGDFIRVILAYVDTRPEMLDDYFPYVAIGAGQSVWPCPP